MNHNTKKTIYLHIGMPKTGTTAIQEFLFYNRHELEQLGLFYPVLNMYDTEEIRNNIQKYPHLYAPNLKLFFCYDYEYKKGRCAEFKAISESTKAVYKQRFEENFLEKIHSSSYSNILFSDEFMSMTQTTPIFLEVLLDFGFNVKVICFLRSPVDWITSLWSQHIKDIKTQLSFHDYLQKTTDFKQIESLLPIITLLGKENVIIRPYEKIQWKNNMLLEDFFDIFEVLLPNNLIQEKTFIRNQSPSRNTIELCRIMTYAGINYYGNRGKLINLKNNEAKVVDTLNDDEILNITERYRHIYTKLANIYGKESFFINEFPSCYGKARAPYKNVTINPEQLEILLEALDINRKQKLELITNLQKENAELKEKLAQK